MEQRAKKRWKKWVQLGAYVLLLGLGLFFLFDYGRCSLKQLQMEPGQLFCLSEEDLIRISLIDPESGIEMNRYPGEDRTKRAIEVLNEYRYSYILPEEAITNMDYGIAGTVEIHTRYRTETYRFSTRGVLKNGLWYCGDARFIGFIPSVLSTPELVPPSSPGPTGIPDFPLPGQEE